MRLVAIVTGVLFILVGLVAMVTGEAAAHGAWVLAVALTVLGLAGLATSATAVSR